MCDINLRNVDAALKSELKIEAAQARMTFKEYCAGLLSGALLRGFTAWKDMGAAVPVQSGRAARVPSDGAALSRAKQAVPANIERTVEYEE